MLSDVLVHDRAVIAGGSIRFQASVRMLCIMAVLYESPCHVPGSRQSGITFHSFSQIIHDLLRGKYRNRSRRVPGNRPIFKPVPGYTGSPAASDLNFHDSLCPKGHGRYMKVRAYFPASVGSVRGLLTFVVSDRTCGFIRKWR